MELQKMINQYINYDFENVINIRDRYSCRIYNDSNSTLNLHTGKITERYLEQQIDKTLKPLDMQVWAVLNANRNIKDVHILLKKGYLNENEKMVFTNKLLRVKYKNTNYNRFTRVCFIEIDENNNLSITVFEKNKKVMYTKLNEFMLYVYNIDCVPYVKKLLNNNTKYNNIIYKPYIEYIKRHNLDNNLFKLSIFLYQDLFDILALDDKNNNTNEKTFYTINIDCFCKSANGIDTLYEFKNKTKDNCVIINEKEFELFEDFSIEFTVKFIIMMSNNEQNTKNSLIEEDNVYSDTDLYYLSFDKNIKKYTKHDIVKNQNVYKIPLEIFTNFITETHLNVLNKTKNIPFIKDWKNKKNNLENLKQSLISNLKVGRIIKNSNDVEIVEYYNNSILICYIKNINKYIAIKYVYDKSWKVLITEKDINILKNKKVDFIGVTKIYVDDKLNINDNVITFLGYTTIENFILNSDKCANKPNIWSNTIFWNFCKMTEDEKEKEIEQYGLIYSYSLDIQNTIHFDGTSRIGVKPYKQLEEFNISNIL